MVHLVTVVMDLLMRDVVNTPESGSFKTRGQTNWGLYPSIAMIVEADQKLSSGGEGRLTRDLPA